MNLQLVDKGKFRLLCRVIGHKWQLNHEMRRSIIGPIKCNTGRNCKRCGLRYEWRRNENAQLRDALGEFVNASDAALNARIRALLERK
jgi:hypothetical protein